MNPICAHHEKLEVNLLNGVLVMGSFTKFSLAVTLFMDIMKKTQTILVFFMIFYCKTCRSDYFGNHYDYYPITPFDKSEALKGIIANYN